MPTANDYEAGAQWWRRQSGSLAQLAGALNKGVPESALGTCPVRTLLDDSSDVTHLNLVNVANEFDALAAECVRRQGVCADYDAALGVYDVNLSIWLATPADERGARPSRPEPPYPWVEASS